MIIYISLCYVFMTAIALVIVSLDGRNITWKDWVLWLTAPVSLPIFLIFYIYYKHKNKTHEDNHSNQQGDSDQLPEYW